MFGRRARVGNDALRLAAGFEVGLVKPHLELRLEERRLLRVLLRFAQLQRRFVSVLFQQQPRLFKLLYRRFKARALGTDTVLRILDDLIAQPETL